MSGKTVTDIVVRYVQTGEGTPEGGKQGSVSQRQGSLDRRLLLPCANPACKKGGFPLRKAIDGAIAAEETERTIRLDCAGYTGARVASLLEQQGHRVLRLREHAGESALRFDVLDASTHPTLAASIQPAARVLYSLPVLRTPTGYQPTAAIVAPLLAGAARVLLFGAGVLLFVRPAGFLSRVVAVVHEGILGEPEGSAVGNRW